MDLAVMLVKVASILPEPKENEDLPEILVFLALKDCPASSVMKANKEILENKVLMDCQG